MKIEKWRDGWWSVEGYVDEINSSIVKFYECRTKEHAVAYFEADIATIKAQDDFERSFDTYKNKIVEIQEELRDKLVRLERNNEG